jgi:glycosyltransferase involved in cell wall biosynthesis
MTGAGTEARQVPEISVIVATFDRPAALARCLNSLLGQKLTRMFEIIVVDNHPQSRLTAAVAERFPTVRWLQEPVAGLSVARNTGIKSALGAVLVTTDDDVIAPTDWLERLTTPLFQDENREDENREDKNPPAATTGNCLPWKVETEAEALFEAYGGLRHGEKSVEFDTPWVKRRRLWFPQLWRIGSAANAAFRASLFHEPAVGLFETRLGAGSPAGAWEDLYLFYRILNAGYRIRYLPEAQLEHAHREDLAALNRQLCAYRRGETAFLTLVLIRHRDWRAIGQVLYWIPQYRVALLLRELGRRLSGRRRFLLRVIFSETLCYLAGPWSLWRGSR